jgi:hypothetical protein
MVKISFIYCFKSDEICLHCKKKLFDIPVPSRDVTYQFTKLSLGGNNDVIYKLFPPRESLVNDIPAGDGNIEQFFLRCEVVKGTVRPDQSSQKKIPLHGKAQGRMSTAICFTFVYFDFEFSKRVQSSLLLHTKFPLTSSVFGRRLVLNPFFLFTGTLLFDEKIAPKCCAVRTAQPEFRRSGRLERGKHKC